MIFVILGILVLDSWLCAWARSDPSNNSKGAALAIYRHALAFVVVMWACLIAPKIAQRIEAVVRVHQQMRVEQPDKFSFSSPPTRSDKQWLGLDRESRFSR